MHSTIPRGLPLPPLVLTLNLRNEPAQHVEEPTVERRPSIFTIFSISVILNFINKGSIRFLLRKVSCSRLSFPQRRQIEDSEALNIRLRLFECFWNPRQFETFFCDIRKDRMDGNLPVSCGHDFVAISMSPMMIFCLAVSPIS